MNELMTLQKIEQAKLAIMEVKTLEEIKQIVNKTEALKAYARSANESAEIQAHAAELNLRAKRRLGEISRDLEKAKPGVKPKELLPGRGSNSKTGALAKAGIDIKRAIEAETLAKIDEDVFETKIAEAKEASEQINKSLFEEIQKKQKNTEYYMAAERVRLYRKTGVKPKGWRDGVDDELAREAEENAAMVEARSKELAEKEGQEAKYKDDPFPDQFQDYLDGMDSDAHRIAVCKRVQKICKQTLASMQRKPAAAAV